MLARKRRNIMILALCFVLVFMGIGYAILTQTLDVTGTSDVDGVWQVNITSINATKINGKAINKNTTITNGGKTANFTADLFDIGDYVEYTVTVKNEGNIAAKVTNVNQSVTNANQHVKMSVDGISKNNVIQPGKSINFTAKVYVDAQSSSDLEDQEGIIFTITLDFVQTQNKQNVIVDNGGNGKQDNYLFDIDISKTTNDNVRAKFYEDGRLVIYGTGNTYDAAMDSVSIRDWGLQTYINLKYMAQQLKINENALMCEGEICDKYLLTSHTALGLEFFEYDMFETSVLNNSEITQNEKEILTRMVTELPAVTSIEIEEGVTGIGDGLFALITGTESIVFPDFIQSIGEAALTWSNYKNIKLPENDNYTIIRYGLCEFCEEVENIIIPDNVQIIENSVFSNASKLTNVSIGTGVTTIGEKAFYKSNLTSISVPSNVTTIGKNAFRTNSLQTVNLYGNSTRFDSSWSDIFGSATKVAKTS